MGNCSNERRQNSSARGTLALLAGGKKHHKITLCLAVWGEYPIINLTELSTATVRYIGLKGQDFPWRRTFGTQDNPEASHNRIQNKSGEYSEGGLAHSFQCKIEREGGKLSVQVPVEGERNQCWQFLWENREIKQGDRFRLGRSVYQLVKLAVDSSVEVFTPKIASSFQSLYNPEVSGETCRICLSSTQVESDPLVSPCLCSGSIRYIHLECLSRWLFGSQYHEGCTWVNRSICELCQTDMTASSAFQKLQESMTDSLHNSCKPYAIFQVYRLGKKTRSYFMMNLAKKRSYTIGRNNKADICDTLDPCISKIHARLTFSNNKLYLSDCDSRHGTLVSMQKLLYVAEGQVRSIAYHNILLQIYNY